MFPGAARFAARIAVDHPGLGDFYAAFIARRQESYRFLIRPSVIKDCTQRSKGEVPMFDVVMLILGIGSFGLFLGYVTVCEIL